MELSCPHCGVGLSQASYEGVALYACGECQGQWLRGGELREIISVRERTFTEAERAELAEKERVFELDHLKEERRLDCPDGHGAMDKYRYGGDSPVVLDRCGACDGTWLDGGELEQVQILAERWEKEQARDLIEHGARLNEVRSSLSSRLDPTGGASIDSPLVNAVVRGILRWW